MEEYRARVCHTLRIAGTASISPLQPHADKKMAVRGDEAVKSQPGTASLFDSSQTSPSAVTLEVRYRFNYCLNLPPTVSPPDLIHSGNRH